MRRIRSVSFFALATAITAFAPGIAKASSISPHDDIIDVAVQAGSFQTLVAAVEAAGLVETLRGDGPFTVFAPTDEAFSRLPAGTVDNLLRPENRDQLVALLTLHVVSGKVESRDILNVGEAQTLNGKPLSIGLRVGGAQVIQADVLASNGIIHVIDEVLIPQESSASTSMAMNLIRTAVSRGAPLYNQGHIAACTALYVDTAHALLGMDSRVRAAVQHPLSRAIEQMNDSHDASERAWAMRRGLDNAYAALSHSLMSSNLSGH